MERQIFFQQFFTRFMALDQVYKLMANQIKYYSLLFFQVVKLIGSITENG